MAFEYLQGVTLHSLSGQPVPVLGHSHTEKVFPYVQAELPAFHRAPTASGPVTACH